MNNFWNQTLPNWIMALAAAWGVFEIIRGYFKLKKQQKENEQKIDFFNEQLNEFRKQTTQFEYQTTIMNENNKILENGIGNLIGILGKGQEAEEQKLEIERQRKIIEIRPNFVFNSGSSAPQRFEIVLRNQGGTANSIRILDVNSTSFSVNSINEQRSIEKGQELRINGQPKAGQNANLASGQILLGFFDIEGNPYQQNIIKNFQGYQLGLPTLISN